MNVVVIVLFCAIPMVAWAATLIAMKGYALTGEKMKEIQAVNASAAMPLQTVWRWRLPWRSGRPLTSCPKATAPDLPFSFLFINSPAPPEENLRAQAFFGNS